MTVQLPETLQYGKVVGRFVLAVADTSTDPDHLPDAMAAVGSVTFTSINPLTKEFLASPPTTVVRSVIPAAVGPDGLLYNPKDPDGPKGIWLVSGAYRVGYSLAGATIPGHDIVVLPEHDDDSPLNLINALPPGGPILTASQYAELSSRLDGIEAGAATWDSISSKPTSFPPSTHKAAHATGGTDALTPADIGAATTGHMHAPPDLSGYVPTSRTVNGKPLSSNVTLTAGDVGAATPSQVSSGDSATLAAAQNHAQGLVDALTAASPATLDTLAEIADALGEDPNFAATMTTALANRVRVDAAQSLTVPQQAQARTNIGAGTSNLAIGTTGTTAAAGNRAASTTAIGMVELADYAETITGTDTARAVTPAGVKAVADTKVPLTESVRVVWADSNLSTSRLSTAICYWQFAAGTDVGASGSNIVNALEGDLYYVYGDDIGGVVGVALQVGTPVPIVALSGAQTTGATHAGKDLHITASSGVDLTVQTAPAGTVIQVRQSGAGALTCVGDGVTLTAMPGMTLISAGVGARFAIVYTSSSTADVLGWMVAA